MDEITSLDPKRFAEYQAEYKNTVCGRHPISVLLHVRICSLSFPLSPSLSLPLPSSSLPPFFSSLSLSPSLSLYSIIHLSLHLSHINRSSSILSSPLISTLWPTTRAPRSKVKGTALSAMQLVLFLLLTNDLPSTLLQCSQISLCFLLLPLQCLSVPSPIPSFLPLFILFLIPFSVCFCLFNNVSFN